VIGPEPVFSAVAVPGAGLLTWTLSMPGAPTSPQPQVRDVARAITSRPVLAATWLVALPSLFAGVLDVLAPLRLDDLGASGVAIGLVFLLAAGIEGVVSRILGDVSDRLGRRAPILAGLTLGIPAALLLPVPETVVLLAAAVILAVVALGFMWAPAMALLSDSAERRGLDQGFALALVNLAWAGAQVIGGSGGAWLAEATTDAVPYLIVAALFTLTWFATTRVRRPAIVAPARR
jgi:MFS family permease